MSQKVFPRVLHQTVKDKGKIPPLWQECRQTWIESCLFSKTAENQFATNKSWDFRLYDDADNDDFVRTKYPQYHRLYRSLPKPINRVDMVRYLFMHYFGGLYVDMD